MKRDAEGFVSALAPAKLNLFLHVTGRRADGYHTLQTVFRMLDHGDRVRVRVREDSHIVRVNDIAGVPADDDLVVRAARLLQEQTGCRLGADIHVEKRLPMGGGLGGGSSDAATTLLLLNRLWQTNEMRADLQDWALALGADVPFFIFGRTALAEGVGEALQPLALPENAYVVIEPPVSVPTPQIFRDEGLTRDTEAVIISASSVGSQSSETDAAAAGEEHASEEEKYGSTRVLDDAARSVATIIARQTRNDLQPVACRLYPQVQQALDMLLPFGGPDRQPRMSGSGGCVFLPCATRGEAKEVVSVLQRILPERWRAWCAASLDVHPLHGWARD